MVDGSGGGGNCHPQPSEDAHKLLQLEENTFGCAHTPGGLPTVARIDIYGARVQCGLPSEAHVLSAGAHRRAFGAMVGILRLDHERRMVDMTGIEPVTSSMPLMRAPNCATGPLGKFLS